EYVAGESLAARLARGRFEDVAEAVGVATQVAAALAAVHAAGLVHRDLKPGNVLLDGTGRAVLTDFGLARLLDDRAGITAAGVMVGTPAYMAPEQVSGDFGPVGPWTDVYSLGLVLYEMLTGRLPFSGSVTKLLHAITHDTPPPPSRHRDGLDGSLEA